MTQVIRTRQLFRLEIGVAIVLVLSIVSVLVLAGGYFKGVRQADRFWPILTAVNESELTLLQSHLHYEDALATGDSGNIGNIWEAFDHYAGVFEHLSTQVPSVVSSGAGNGTETQLAAELKALSAKISECKAIAQRNWEKAGREGFGVPHDQEFDHAFNGLMERMSIAHALVSTETLDGFKTGSSVFNFTWSLWLVLVLFTWAILILGLRRLHGIARELAESEGRYRALVDALPIGVLHTDETGQCTFANRGWTAMVGQAVSDAVDSGWMSAIDEHDREEALKAWFKPSQAASHDSRYRSLSEQYWRLLSDTGEPVYVSVKVGSYDTTDRQPRRRFVLAVMNHSEQRAAELALAESEARYRSLVELAPDAILVQTEGIVRYANAATVRIFGADHVDELLGRPLEELVRTDFQHAVQSRLQRALAGESDGEPMEQVAMGLNGKQIPIEARSTHTLYEGKPATLAYIRDIEEQKKADSALRFERTLLHMLMDNVPDLIYFKDRRCRFTRVNSAMAATLGVQDPAQLVGRSDSEFDDPWQAQMRFADEQRLLETGEPLVGRLEKVSSSGNGAVRWYSTTKVPLSNGSGAIIGLVAVSRDITKQRQIDEALSRSEVRFRQLAESIDEAFWLTAPDGSETYYVNPSYERITGMSGESLYTDPQSWRTLVHPDDQEAAHTQLIPPDSNEANDLDRGVEIRLLCQGGEYRWVWLRTRVVHDEDGKPVALAGVMVDITKRKQAEIAIESQWEFLQAVIDGLPDPLVVYGRDRRVKMMNSRMRARTEYAITTCTEVCENVWLYDDESERCAVCAVTSVFETGTPCTSERVARAEDGSLLHLEISAAPIIAQDGTLDHVLVSFRDITDRRRSEDAVRESEARFRQIFENSPVSKLLVDEQGMVMVVNKRFAEKTGYPEEAVIGHSISEFLYRQQSVGGTLVREAMQLKDVRTNRDVNAKLTVESGRILDVLVSGNQTDDPAGPTITLLALRDISEQKRAERINRYRLKLEQLLARISTRFINLSAPDMEKGIESAISDAGEFLQADITAVMLYDESRQVLERYCNWSAEPGVDVASLLPDLHLTELPWLAHEFEQDHIVMIRDIEQMPAEAADEQRTLCACGVKAAVIVPMKSEGRLIGCISARTLDTAREWEEPDTGLLRMVSEMISGALFRKRSYEELQRSQLKYRRLATSRQMLLEELNHRVLNNLTSLMTLVTMMERSGRSTGEFVEALRSRLGAFTAVHQVIAGRGWQEVDLRNLLQNLVGTFEPNREIRQRIRISGPPVLIRPKTAQTIAVIVQELLTNSRKYGAHSVPEGAVQFQWEIIDQQDDFIHVNMVWSERGGPCPDRQPPLGHGLGIRLVRGFVSFELRGRCEFDFKSEGLECRISCVLETGRMDEAQNYLPSTHTDEDDADTSPTSPER